MCTTMDLFGAPMDLFGAPVDTYNLCMWLSFFIILIAVALLKPKKLRLEYAVWATIIVWTFAYLGAKLLNIILHSAAYSGRDILDLFTRSGVSYLGAPILGLLAFWIFCRIIKISFLVFVDYIAPFFMLDRIIGRIGCLGYGCCHGIPSSLPWAYSFRGWRIMDYIVQRHPTQAYELIYALAIFISARYLYKRLKAIPGVFAFNHKDAPLSGITSFYVIFCYSFLRFFNEFLRAEGPFISGSIKLVHIALFIFAAIALTGFFIIIKKSPEKGEILKALKSAGIRLAVWFVASGVVILSLISSK